MRLRRRDRSSHPENPTVEMPVTSIAPVGGPAVTDRMGRYRYATHSDVEVLVDDVASACAVTSRTPLVASTVAETEPVRYWPSASVVMAPEVVVVVACSTGPT